MTSESHQHRFGLLLPAKSGMKTLHLLLVDHDDLINIRKMNCKRRASNSGLFSSRVLLSLTKSRCQLRSQPKLQHFKWRADGAEVGMVIWNCPATAATPPVTPFAHSENRSSP